MAKGPEKVSSHPCSRECADRRRRGMAVPWIEGGTFMPNGSIQVAAGMYQPSQYPGDATPGSAGSPEPQPQPYIVHPPQHHINGAYLLAQGDPTDTLIIDMSPRGSPPPFVLADPEVLGFPVYSKPITAPKLVLSNFPKAGTKFPDLWPKLTLPR